ncbi:MAG: hypothetical protein HY815_28700 [Candidatus Riflebacteria bacterium]|nr:hypothetical protein [Candidatus Riflebacteria bacterium]
MSYSDLNRSPFSAFPLCELKLVYRVARDNLLKNSELAGSQFLSSLQIYLTAWATAEGVDASDPVQLAGWLDDVASAGDAEWFSDKRPFRLSSN